MTLLAPEQFAGFLGAAILVVNVYSYFVWRKDPDKMPPPGTLPANRGT